MATERPETSMSPYRDQLRDIDAQMIEELKDTQEPDAANLAA
jgi:hypothetical protein